MSEICGRHGREGKYLVFLSENLKEISRLEEFGSPDAGSYLRYD